MDRLSVYDSVVEVGIGSRTAVAEALVSRGVDVTATDLRHCDTPPGVRFVCDDVTAPDTTVYEGVDAIYALNFPPELHSCTATLTQAVDAAFLFTTLGADPPTVPVTRETVPGETIFVHDPEPA